MHFIHDHHYGFLITLWVNPKSGRNELNSFLHFDSLGKLLGTFANDKTDTIDLRCLCGVIMFRQSYLTLQMLYSRDRRHIAYDTGGIDEMTCRPTQIIILHPTIGLAFRKHLLLYFQITSSTLDGNDTIARAKSDVNDQTFIPQHICTVCESQIKVWKVQLLKIITCLPGINKTALGQRYVLEQSILLGQIPVHRA